MSRKTHEFCAATRQETCEGGGGEGSDPDTVQRSHNHLVTRAQMVDEALEAFLPNALVQMGQQPHLSVEGCDNQLTLYLCLQDDRNYPIESFWHNLANPLLICNLHSP